MDVVLFISFNFQLFRFKYCLKGWQPQDIRENIFDAVTTASKSIHREERAVFEESPPSSRYHLRCIPRQLPDYLLMLVHVFLSDDWGLGDDD